MKSYKNLFDICISESNRRMSIKTVKQSKRIKRIIKQKHLSDDDLLLQSYNWIVNYKHTKHTPVYIHDGMSKKVRKIIVPTMEELIVQHNVVNVLKPIFLKGMYKHTYASIPGRGSHKGKKVIEKWIRKDPKNVKYVLKMDIYHFFECIPHNILKSKLSKLIKDEEMLDLLFKIIDISESGIPLGFHTSQWLSNWYLQELDHYIKEQLKVLYYIRYMDDMVIFGSNKKELHKIKNHISQFLENRLGLRLKNTWQIFRFSYIKNGKEKGRDLDFMGFRFYRNRTTLRKSIMIRTVRKARKISKKNKPTIYDARQMISYLGWINCTDTYGMYIKHIKPFVCFQQLKRKISTHNKYDDRRLYLYHIKPYKTI